MRQRRAKGVKPRQVGCSKHGWVPASECLGCKWDKAQKRYEARRAAGVSVKPVGCSPHNYFPARECRACKAEDQRNIRARERRILNRESARLAEYSRWEAEQVGKPDAEQKLLERVVRDNALGKEAQAALDELNAALDMVESKCKDKPEYADGEFHKYEAEAMCADCPVLELCGAYGKALKRDNKRRGYKTEGIYGGKRAEDIR